MMEAISNHIGYLAISLSEKAIIAAICVGICCGLLGCFVVVRRVALLGDAISHAVFPGVVAGFMWSDERNPSIIFSCALLAGLFGVLVVRAIVTSTRLKSDAALGIVLASFFAIGVFWNSTKPFVGVNSFLFGDLTTISDADLWLMIGATLIVSILVILFLRPFRVVSFDEGYARGLGYPVKLLNGLFFGLLAFSVVVALQAVGVILVSAMLITPAATAYLLSDRIQKMMGLSVLFGIMAALGGWWIANLDVRFQSGPMITLFAAFLFAMAYFLSPRHGVLAKFMRHAGRKSRVHRENTLKAIYRIIENDGFRAAGVGVEQLAEDRKFSLEQVTKDGQQLVRSGEATWEEGKTALYLTSPGWRRATEIVRNHRLWELYLTNQADYAADHVHEDAEKIEHILGADTVRKLERALNFPECDPHGKPIPSLESTLQMEQTSGKQEETGY
jgi:ABC-type Mn2+/Zn2+ transport system permease subunit/Mn-dependent DtxR family transcriptional regulator